jgi:hypothetical protein
MNVRRLFVAAVGIVLGGGLVSGCSESPDRAGSDAASATADNITRYLQNHVVTSTASSINQLAKVRGWLLAPSAGYTKSYPEPDLRILSASSQQIEVAVYAYGETTALDGKDGAWGHVCRRYTATAAGRLDATEIDCPKDLPPDPNP